MALAPNDEAVIQAVYKQRDWKLRTHEGLRAYTQASVLALHKKNPKWGHLIKKPGQTQIDGRAEDSALYLGGGDAPYQSVDFVAGANPGPSDPDPRPTWQPDTTPRYQASDWDDPTKPKYNQGLEPTPSNTLLGKSVFWAWVGYKSFRSDLDEALDAVKKDLEGDYIRWFFTVGGNFVTGQDPWSIVGTNFNDPQHFNIAKGLMELLKTHFLKSHLTLCGGLNPDGTVGDMYKTEEQRFAIVDSAAKLINLFPNDFVMVEIWNEYEVNGSNRAWCRAMARRLRSQIPSHILIALSSPNSVMGGQEFDSVVKQEIDNMHGGLPEANGRTLHSTRPSNHWNPNTIHRVDPNRYLDGEPMGPGASAGGDITNPAILGANMQEAVKGNAIGFTLHTEPGVWGHKLDPAWPLFHPEWKKFRDITNWKQICETLKAVKNGQPIPEPEPEPDPMIPYDEAKSIEFGEACNRVYIDNNIPQDPGMISVHSSRAAWDYYVGKLPWEESFKKHINELRAVYNLPPV